MTIKKNDELVLALEARAINAGVPLASVLRQYFDEPEIDYLGNDPTNELLNRWLISFSHARVILHDYVATIDAGRSRTDEEDLHEVAVASQAMLATLRSGIRSHL